MTIVQVNVSGLSPVADNVAGSVTPEAGTRAIVLFEPVQVIELLVAPAR